MLRPMIALLLAATLAAPALADTCAAATDAATRSALAAAAAKGQRTATVRVRCDGARQTFVIHTSGSTVTVREVKPPADAGLEGAPAPNTATKVIRVGR
jgi:hypothetical protein